MCSVSIKTGTIVIPTYPEGKTEELPMFAENRVHQRTSGRPYPNKVVMSVDRSHKINKEYKLVTIENEYLKIEILPEIGGRIYSALDKTTGYDFFYKQHVIKPALIGVLGSWISGGVEFNWPFHHRASGFMPCDFVMENLPDGSAACHLSEHDPIDRMKGMVSIILRPGEKRFETRMSLYNRTPEQRSFLWWENAAVPVNKSYRIFFPKDVSYVNFHYLKSRASYPVAGNCVYNGIPMDSERDISWHKNTTPATSYFACASRYDFFGGYDYGKQCGVVHIGDHHISPGKKMFTWGYCQLAKSWENALTDTDGQYAELMAGSYSDNQPNFSWIAPYETKEFLQYWYPISEIGVPDFANLDCAFAVDKEKHVFKLQTTKEYKGLIIKIYDVNRVYYEKKVDIIPGKMFDDKLPDITDNVTVCLSVGKKHIAQYTEKDNDKLNMPDVITDMPSAGRMNSADELYLAGVHVKQYRDPAVLPDSYWKAALKRNIDHIPSLVAMAKFEMEQYNISVAENYAKRAIAALSIYNERHESGEAYYTYGRILERQGDPDKAYDLYYKAYFCADCAARAMTRIAMIDIKRQEYEQAVIHAEKALDYGRKNNLAISCLAIAKKELGEDVSELVSKQLRRDKLDHMMRYIAGKKDLYEIMDSDPVETCLDIAFDLAAMGRYEDIVKLLSGLEKERSECRIKPLYYTLGYYKMLCGANGVDEYNKGDKALLGSRYPERFEEIAILDDVASKSDSADAKMLLGCLLYNKRHYKEAAALWETCDDNYIAKRNLAVAYFSHLGKHEAAMNIMNEVLMDRPSDEQILYEAIILMDKMNISPDKKIKLITSSGYNRDDVITELAKAYNQAFEPDKALETLLSHDFVPCEGGEHAIADQYMFACLVKGNEELSAGKTAAAREWFRKGQILPQSLGAGIWNHCKLVPLKYYEALCMEDLGRKSEADEIFEYISGIEIEYFSNMHLKELPYWQAKACLHLGKRVKAQQLITKYKREWENIKDIKDNGYFGTTPFFISFMDDPQKLRKAQWLYLMALCDDFGGYARNAAEKLDESLKIVNENILAQLFKRFGFLK